MIAIDPHRWPITPEIRAEIVKRITEIATGDDLPLAIRAARILIQMDAQNLQDTDTDTELRQKIRDQLRERRCSG